MSTQHLKRDATSKKFCPQVTQSRSGTYSGDRLAAARRINREGNSGALSYHPSLVSTTDRAVTVRERDLITDRIPIDFISQSASGSPRTSFPIWVCRIPLPHGHGSVNWRHLNDLLANEVSGKQSALTSIDILLASVLGLA